MKSPENKPLPENFERLIAEEEAAAVAKFRAGDFSGRVRRAVAAEGSSAAPRPVARRVPGWAWAAGALLTAAGVLAYLAVPKPAGIANGAAFAELVRFPGLDGLEAWEKDAALAPTPSSPVAGGFAAALAGMKTSARPAGEAAAAERIPPSHLGLEKLMEILIRDGAVAKTLSLMSPKFKEG
jgi:hypothetical protein